VPEVSPAASDKPEDGEIVVPLVGDLTFETVDALQEQLWDLMDAGCRLLILDAAELEFIDSGAWGCCCGHGCGCTPATGGCLSEAWVVNRPGCCTPRAAPAC